MTKLYKILGEKLRFFHDKSAEPGFFNPLDAAPHCPVAIDYLDFRGQDWFVEDVRQYETDLGDKKYFLADYLLAAKDLEGGERRVKLRIVAGPKAMILTKTDEMEYDEGFERDVLNDPSLQFNVDYDDERGQHVREEYFRCGGVKPAYKAAVKSIGREATGESAGLKYWDYSRTAEIDGVSTEQYLYVEMSTTSGYITIWQGEELPLDCVEVFAATSEVKG